MAKSSKLLTIMKIVTALVFVAAVLGFAARMNNRAERDLSGVPDALSSTVRGGACSLTVAANADRIGDKEAFARETVRMCRENSFRSLRLSTDIAGWPERVYITVYLHREDAGKEQPVMRIRYEPAESGAECNIKDDPDKYILSIE